MMLSLIWAGMILTGVIYGALTGNLGAVSNGFVEGSKDAVSMCITMLGVLSFWSGMMEIAKQAGVIRSMTKVIHPFVSFMFPNIPKNHQCREYITTNIIANILGLGWAATPPGLKAMEELSNLETERGHGSGLASDEMCTFLVLNISSLQLIPMNIIAYRSEYGSSNPTMIVGPAILATLASTVAGIIYCKIAVCRRER